MKNVPKALSKKKELLNKIKDINYSLQDEDMLAPQKIKPVAMMKMSGTDD